MNFADDTFFFIKIVFVTFFFLSFFFSLSFLFYVLHSADTYVFIKKFVLKTSWFKTSIFLKSTRPTCIFPYSFFLFTFISFFCSNRTALRVDIYCSVNGVKLV